MTSTSTTPTIFDCAIQSNTGQYIHVRTAKFSLFCENETVRLRAILSGVAIFDEMVEVKNKQILFSDIPFFANFPYAESSYWVFEIYTTSYHISFELLSNNDVMLDTPIDFLKPIGDTGMYVDVVYGKLHMNICDQDFIRIQNRPRKRQISYSQCDPYDNTIPMSHSTIPARL